MKFWNEAYSFIDLVTWLTLSNWRLLFLSSGKMSCITSLNYSCLFSHFSTPVIHWLPRSILWFFFFFLFTILFVFSDSLVFCSTFSAMSSILTLNHLIDIFILDVLWWQISKSSFLPSYHSLCSNIFFCLTKDIIYNLCEIFSTFALFLSLLCSFQLFVFVFSFHVGGRLNRKVLT